MTLGQETLTLSEEHQRLDNRLEDLADKIVQADDPAALRSVGAQVETRLSGVAYLAGEHGPDATVTIRGLTAGDYAEVEDRLAQMRAEAGQEELPGASTNLFAAGGLVTAPFIEDNPPLEDRLAAVADQPVGVAKWLESRVNELTTVEGNGFKRLDRRIADKQTT
jgi:hypothetical protein